MSISPEELLNFAESLSPDDECARRTIGSRAYYANYQRCLEALAVSRDRQRRGGMHKQYIDTLKESANPALQRVGRVLESAYKLRIKADYKVALDFTNRDTADALTLARHVTDLTSK